jgi:hypothetical protein
LLIRPEVSITQRLFFTVDFHTPILLWRLCSLARDGRRCVTERAGRQVMAFDITNGLWMWSKDIRP